MAAVTPSRSGVSPSSSPRLPSPPPIPEVQFGPKSPSIQDVGSELQLDASTRPDEGAARRIRPGTKAADMARGPPLVPLNQLDSPFQLHEHLKALYSDLTHTAGSTRTIPITRETALKLATPPEINSEPVDRNLWLYELCRFLTMKANLVSIYLMSDSPPCSSLTCPEMRASEWQYLCAVHEPPKSCCAIDYCNHTLDWAANVLTSPKHFPSRLQLGGDSGNVFQSMRQLTNIFRRVYRIFAHAWFQHREVFWTVEATHGLYIFFKTVCDEYQLIPEDNYTIPAEAESGRDEAEAPVNSTGPDTASRIQILRRVSQPATPEDVQQHSETQPPTTLSSGATTRRHKHTPSTGSHVGTIAEGQEEEELPPPPPPQEGEEEQSTEGVSSQPASQPSVKNPSPERPLLQTLGPLDIKSTIPAYEPGAPEDPTPTIAGHDKDPLDAAGMKKDEGEEDVMSPSGGSIRTSGSDVLGAILGHMDDLEDAAVPPEKRPEESADEQDPDETMERIEMPEKAAEAESQ